MESFLVLANSVSAEDINNLHTDWNLMREDSGGGSYRNQDGCLEVNVVLADISSSFVARLDILPFISFKCIIIIVSVSSPLSERYYR